MTTDPLALAVLRHLAASRGLDDPLGSLARRVLAAPSAGAPSAGPSSAGALREAVAWSWHGEAVAAAFEAALRERDRMPASERAAYERQAAGLRAADPVTPGPE